MSQHSRAVCYGDPFFDILVFSICLMAEYDQILLHLTFCHVFLLVVVTWLK